MIQQGKSADQFTLSRQSFHTHNGKDSPFIFLPTLTYAGYLNGDGTKSRTFPFPSGWLISHSANGVISIQHNFQSTYYSVQFSQYFSGNLRPMSPVISSQLKNSFTVIWFAHDFAATGAISGTSATLTANWPEATGSYLVVFSTGQSKTVTFTNGATTMTWSGALSATATANFATSLDTSFFFTVTHVANTRQGWPLYNTNAT